jgi:MoxR-like ATPase
MRKPASITKLFTTTFNGIARPRSPLTETEILNAGFDPATRPDGYVEGEDWMVDLSVVLPLGHTIVQGPAGNGKDIFALAYAHSHNLPLKAFAFKEGANPLDWIKRAELEATPQGGTKTTYVEGDLVKACKGVTIKRDFTTMNQDLRSSIKADMEKQEWTVTDNNGIFTITIPAIILFSDYDRATPDQVEVLRQALELGKERLADPISGELFPIAKGTRFIFTANSGADGDGGRGMITRPKDASILNRCQGIYAPPPSAKFERKVVQASYPSLNEEEVKLLVDCTRAIRKVAEEQAMGIEVSLRTALAWAKATLRYKEVMPNLDFKKAMKKSFVIVKGHLSEAHNHQALEGAIDPLLRSDVVDSTTTNPNVCPIDM